MMNHAANPRATPSAKKFAPLTELGSQLLELDINPLILRAEGNGAIAVDARARLEAQGDSDERRKI
jgi:hypothetical protein